MERLQKLLAAAGVASRRAAEELIRAGRVTVNGRVARLGDRADPRRDEVRMDGRRLPVPEPPVYYLLNKPRGYLCTVRDPLGRKTVLDLVPTDRARLFPVGRLDRDTEGLLLLTNDGDLAHALTHPRHRVVKVYLARVEGTPRPEALDRLRRGVHLAEGRTAPAQVRLVKPSVVRLALRQGRKRQVRRMLEAVGHRVLHLRRIQLGPLRLGKLPVGAFRRLTEAEVEDLREAARR